MGVLPRLCLRAELVMLQVSSLKPDAAEVAELRQRVAELQPEAEKAQVTQAPIQGSFRRQYSMTLSIAPMLMVFICHSTPATRGSEL